ncbi:hypothetical protein KFE94_16945 [bacterium SCSIO 12643]|nr:hypothetical protein KFE94_16945 [bacterium SCSIO 12643]
MKQLSVLILGIILTLFSCSLEEQSPDQEIEDKNQIVDTIDSDSVLIQQLMDLNLKDQTLRFVLPDVTKRFGAGSQEEKYFWSLIHQQDSINEKEIAQIIDRYGWLGIDRVGEEANQSLWLIIQHAPLEVQEKYLPLLRASVDAGHSQGWHLAFLEDRVLMRNKKNQIYGTQSLYDQETKTFKIYPIEDVAHVNERREKLGMETVEEFAEMNGYVYDQVK